MKKGHRSITLHENEWLAVMRACWIAEQVTQHVTGIQATPDLPTYNRRTFGATVDAAAGTIRHQLSQKGDK